MTALLIADGARWAIAFALVALFVLLGFAAIGMWLEDHAPIRDEDEELGDRFPIHRRLPL